MPRIEVEIVIRAPIDVVFTAITDPRRTTEWNPNILEVSEASPLPPQQGTSWTQTALVVGRKVKLECTIAQFNPPREGELDIGGGHQARVRTRCRQHESGTRVTQTIDFTPPGGMLGRMAGPMIGQALRNEMTRTLERQRETLEREAESA